MNQTTISPDSATVSKLLLNAWTAEFALRIRPVNADRDYLNASLNWTFPQAYYSTLFSARAVLAADAIYIANPRRWKSYFVNGRRKACTARDLPARLTLLPI